jgi:competence protein ComEA
MFRYLVSIVALVVLISAHVQPASAQAERAPAGRRPSRAPWSTSIRHQPQIRALPGIGVKTAARIIEIPPEDGAFKKIEELMNVRGIGEKNFLKLKAQLTVGPAKPEANSARQN